MPPEKDTLYSIFSIVKALNDAQREAIKEESKNSYFRGEKVLMWLPIFCCIAGIILCAVSNLFKTKLLFQISLGFLAISYLAVTVGLFITVLMYFWTSARKSLRDPLCFIIDNTMKCAEIDATNVNNFYKYEPEALKYVLVELKAERAAWERRVSLLLGAIDKVGIIGIIPGLLALIKSVHLALMPGFPAPWIQAIAYATPFVYGVGLMSHVLMTRLDRFIMLIEMVIEAKKI